MQNWGSLCAALLLVVGCAVAPVRVLAQCGCGAICTCPDCPIKHKDRHGPWHIVETPNFQVCCQHSAAPAAHVARHAETLRNILCVAWLGAETIGEWKPKCQIVLYSNRQSYVAAVGRGGERTVGSSLVKHDKGRTMFRRIDLLGNGTEYLSAALPHELTHIILRDRFPSTVVPRWADEGMAILADTEAKQKRHRRDLQQALAQRRTFHAVELLTMEEYPASNRFGVFYGQSASLTGFLVSRKGSNRFVEFIDRAEKAGYDAALQECYGIDGVGELDRQWRTCRYLVQPAMYEQITKATAKPTQLRSASESSQPYSR